jgi:hypothetical protein
MAISACCPAQVFAELNGDTKDEKVSAECRFGG